MLRDDLEHRVAGKDLFSGQQVVRHTPERVQIGASIDVLAERHLRCHIGGRTHDHALDCGQRLRAVNGRGLDETKIEHLDVAVAPDHDVFRLDVPMNDARGMSGC